MTGLTVVLLYHLVKETGLFRHQQQTVSPHQVLTALEEDRFSFILRHNFGEYVPTKVLYIFRISLLVHNENKVSHFHLTVMKINIFEPGLGNAKNEFRDRPSEMSK